MARQCVDRRDQDAWAIRLEQVAARASLEEFAKQRLALEYGEDQHFRTWVERPDLPNRIDAVHDPKPVAEDGDVRLGRGRELDRLPTVQGLGDHLPSWFAAEDGPKAGTDDVIVVGDQDAGHGRMRPSEPASFHPRPPRSARCSRDAKEARTGVAP